MTTHRQSAFVGVDGEGGDVVTNGRSRHEYLLLRAGTDVLEWGRPLSHEDVLPWLAALPPEHEYVSYFFDYDVTMMLRSLPEETVRDLLDREARTDYRGRVRPVVCRQFEIDYLPRKEFKVRARARHDRRNPWITVSDTGSFFQASFLTTLDRWQIATVQEIERIGEGKAQRAMFGQMTDQIREYNALEVDLLCDLMERFRDLCMEVGYVPRLWQGPGNIASAMFRKHGVPRSSELGHIPDGVWAMAQAAYYGGRFETTAVGPVQGPVYQADINSAYPAACLRLPCLTHGRWHHDASKPLHVARVFFTHAAGKSIYTLPVRHEDGRISYPRTGAGWYWSAEIAAAQRAGAKVDVLEAWSYEKRCGCRPFDFLQTVYDERRRVGKSGVGMVLKLAANSVYGKLAQSIGHPEYANPIWAGLITALTRTTLIEAVRGDPDAVVMLATDGIFSTRQLSLPYGEALGQWDLVTHNDGMFVIQPGLYFAGDQKPKTRGVPMGKILEREAEFRQAWASSAYGTAESTLWERGGRGGVGPAVPSVQIPLTEFVSLRLAYARGKPDTAGQWQDVTKEVSFDWSTKRRPFVVRRDGRGTLRTAPLEGPFKTIPYSKIIGGNKGRDMERLVIDDAPDWAQHLTGLD